MRLDEWDLCRNSACRLRQGLKSNPVLKESRNKSHATTPQYMMFPYSTYCSWTSFSQTSPLQPSSRPRLQTPNLSALYDAAPHGKQVRAPCAMQRRERNLRCATNIHAHVRLEANKSEPSSLFWMRPRSWRSDSACKLFDGSTFWTVPQCQTVVGSGCGFRTCTTGQTMQARLGSHCRSNSLLLLLQRS